MKFADLYFISHKSGVSFNQIFDWLDKLIIDTDFVFEGSMISFIELFNLNSLIFNIKPKLNSFVSCFLNMFLFLINLFNLIIFIIKFFNKNSNSSSELSKLIITKVSFSLFLNLLYFAHPFITNLVNLFL